MRRGDDDEGERRRMPDAPQAESSDDAGIEPGGERHRRGDRSEHDADQPPLVKGIEDDLLDRADVGDERAEADRHRQRVAARLGLADRFDHGRHRIAPVELAAEFGMQRLGQPQP